MQHSRESLASHMDCATCIYTRTRTVSYILLMDLGNGNGGCLGMALESKYIVVHSFWWLRRVVFFISIVDLIDSIWQKNPAEHQELPQESRAVLLCPFQGHFYHYWSFLVRVDMVRGIADLIESWKQHAYLNMRSWNCRHVSWQEAP